MFRYKIERANINCIWNALQNLCTRNAEKIWVQKSPLNALKCGLNNNFLRQNI